MPPSTRPLVGSSPASIRLPQTPVSMSTAQMLAGQKPLPPASIASHTPGIQANSGGLQQTPSLAQVPSSNVSTLTSNTKPAVLQQQQQPLPIQPLPVSQQSTISLPQQPSTAGQAGQLPNLQTNTQSDT